MSADEEKTQAIREFAQLKELNHVRQFSGCTNWIRWYMPTVYPVVVKMLGAYLKPRPEFSVLGLDHEDGTSEGDNAVKAIKVMAVNCI